MRDFFIVGLTGQTGAGKSTVAKFFEKEGFVIIDADKLARQIMEKGSLTLKLVTAVFGNDVLYADGALNRQKLAQKAFSSEENTRLLNEITHPRILSETLKICREYTDKGRKYFLIDAPLLFEGCFDILCDTVVCVTAPKEIRLERLKKRDGLSEEKLLERMNAQHDEEFYIKRADYIIRN
ncbi:MAG: dephospho-CoA kinase [Clostridia bacterium]|nr:dephospho-CoA kinase [Clostridia bacterium]